MCELTVVTGTIQMRKSWRSKVENQVKKPNRKGQCALKLRGKLSCRYKVCGGEDDRMGHQVRSHSGFLKISGMGTHVSCFQCLFPRAVH